MVQQNSSYCAPLGYYNSLFKLRDVGAKPGKANHMSHTFFEFCRQFLCKNIRFSLDKVSFFFLHSPFNQCWWMWRHPFWGYKLMGPKKDPNRCKSVFRQLGFNYHTQKADTRVFCQVCLKNRIYSGNNTSPIKMAYKLN